jgi:hypothetical protein
MTTTILADWHLRELIERLDAAGDYLYGVLPRCDGHRPEKLAVENAIDALDEAAEFLNELRESEHATQ